MALDKQKLILEVEAKAGNTQKVLRETGMAVTGLGDKAISSSDKTNKALSDIEKKYQKLAKQVLSMPDVQKALQIKRNTIDKSNKNIKDYSDIIIVTSTNTDKFTKSLNQNNKALKAYRGESMRLMDVVHVFDAIRSSIANFIRVMDILSDPATLGKIQSLIKGMALLARIKGFDDQSKKLLGMSETLGQLKKSLEDSGVPTLEGQLLSLEEKVNRGATAFKIYDGVITALKIGTVGVGLAVVANQFKPVNDLVVKTTASMKIFGKQSFSAGMTLAKNVSPGLLGVAQDSASVAPLLLGLSGLMINSENDAIRFAGGLTAVAAIMAGALSFGIFMLMKSLASLSEQIGDKLIGSMGEFEKKAAKAESITKTFQFTIEGFGKTLGTEVVGSLKQWNEVLAEVGLNSLAAGDDLRKSIKLLVADASVLGISFKQNENILKRAADIAASQGKNIVDVTNSIISALNGQAIGLRNMGVDLSEGGLNHSKYAKKVGLNTKALDEQGIVQARYNVLLEKTIPILGAATAATETIIGVQTKLDQTFESIQVRLGEAGEFTKAYIVTLNELATAFLNLPDGVINAIGATQDFLGVTLKVSGVVFKYIFSLASLITGYATLKSLLAGNVVAQWLLTKAFGFAAAAVGVQGVAVNSLSTAYLNLAIITKGVLASALTSIGAIFKGLALIIKDVTLSLLANPLFAKALLIAAGVIIIVKAVSELSSDLENNISVLNKNTDAIAKNAKAQSMLSKLFEGMKEIGTGLMRFFINLTKLLLTGVLVAFLEMLKVIGFIGQAITKLVNSDFKGFDQGLKKINKTVDEAQNLGAGFAIAMVTGFEDTAEAAEAASEKIKAIKNNMRAIKEAAKGINESDLRIEIFGDDFDKATLKARQSLEEYNKLQDRVRIGTEKIEDAEKKLRAARVLAARDFLALTNMQTQELNKFKKIRVQSSIQQLKDSGQLVEASKAESKQRLATFEITVKGLMKINKITKEGLRGVNATRRALQEQAKVSLELAKTKEHKEKLKEMKPVLDMLTKLDERTVNINEQIAKSGKTELEAIRAVEKARLGEINKLEKKLKLHGEITKAQQKTLDEGKTAVKAQATAKVEKVTGGASEGFIGALQGITSSVTGAASSMMGMAGAMSNMVTAIVGIVSAILDIIPGILNMFADIVNKITDFPKIIQEAVGGLFDSLLSFVTDFIPNLMATLEELPKMFNEFLIAMPDAFLGLVDNLPSIIDSFIDSIPEVTEKFINAIIKGAPKFIKAILDFWFKAIPKMVLSVIKMIPDLVKAIVNGIVTGLKEGFNAIFGDVFNIDTDKMGGDISNSWKKAGADISDATSEMFNVSDLQDSIAGQDQAEKIGEAIADGTKKAVAWLIEAWHKIWNGIKQIFNEVVASFTALWDFTKVIFEGIVNLFTGLWEAAKTIFKVITDAFSGVFDAVFKAFEDVVAALKNVFDTVADVGGKIWDGFKTAAGSLADFFGDMGTAIWNGLKSGLDGIGKIFTNIFDAINPNNLFEKIFKVDSKGTGTVEKAIGIDIPFANFASGGVVPGTAKAFGDSELNDTVPAFLSPGEAVIPRSAMQDKSIAKLINSIVLNGQLPKFSLGGDIVAAGKKAGGDISDAGKSGGGALSSAFKESLKTLGVTDPWDAIKDKTFGMVLKMFEANKFSTGGIVGSDTVPAMLTPGEFVMNKPSVDNIGVDKLRAMNSGQGLFGQSSGGSVVNHNNFKIEITGDNIDQNFIENELFPMIEDKLRRQSLDGQRVLSSRGVR